MFFVISGFLITGILIREWEANGKVNFQRFYARRARRLLPGALLALATSALLSLMALPASRWSRIGDDIISSALYVVNWRLAGRSVDYLAEGSAPSPVQHFWSLSIEEQFYFVWPLLIAAVAAFAVRRRKNPRLAVGLAITAISLASLSWSVWYTGESPLQAYFVSTTRVWELGMGAALALFVPALTRMPAHVANALGWAGLIAVIAAITLFDSATSFPSYSALLPTLGTASLLAAGTAQEDSFLMRGLGSRIGLWFGALSYSLYLFHWPIVVVALHQFRGPETAVGLGAVTFSILPAYLSYRFVENPIRHSQSFANPPARGLRIGLALMIASVLVGLVLTAVVTASEQPQTVDATSPPPADVFIDIGETEGPSKIDETTVDSPTPADQVLSYVNDSQVPIEIPLTIRPPLTSVVDDLPVVYELGCHAPPEEVEPTSCSFGSAGPLIALVGDSHAAQWVPAFRQLVETERWRLMSFTKSGCPLGTMITPLRGEPYEECTEWNLNTMDEIMALGPDLIVVASSTTNLPLRPDGTTPGTTEAERLYVEGVIKAIRSWTDGGLKAVMLADTPRPAGNIPDCLGTFDTTTECTAPRSAATAPQLHASAAESLPNVHLIDMTPWICTRTECPPIIGDVIVWRDTHHLTAEYATVLAKPLGNLLGDIYDVLR